MLEEPIKEGVPPKMKGSVLMCVADTEEEVLERVKKDVYYTSDVWDKEKVSAGCARDGACAYLWNCFGRGADCQDRFRFSRSRVRLGWDFERVPGIKSYGQTIAWTR